MPLILTKDQRSKWLDKLDRTHIEALIKPLDDGLLQAHQISKLITSITEDRNVPKVQEEVPSDTLFLNYHHYLLYIITLYNYTLHMFLIRYDEYAVSACI